MTSTHPFMAFCLIASIASPAGAETAPIGAAVAREAVRLAAFKDPAPPANGAGRPDISSGAPLELKWSELPAIITAERVEVMTDRGTVTGEVVTVRDEGLLVDVKNASNPQAYGKGNGVIPRNSIALIKLERRRGSWGRNLGTVVGVISGLVVGGYVTGTVANSPGAGIPLFLGMTAGITTAGYYAGKQLDTQITLIRVVQ